MLKLYRLFIYNYLKLLKLPFARDTLDPLNNICVHLAFRSDVLQSKSPLGQTILHQLPNLDGLYFSSNEPKRCSSDLKGS